MWVLARVTGPHASEKYMAQFFLELNTVSSGPYFIIALENTEGTDCIWPRFVYQQWRMHYKISNGTFWVLQIVSDENHWRRELKLQVWTWKARQFICVIMQGSDDASGGWGWGLHHIWMDLQIRKRQATRGPLTTDHGACMLSMGTLCWIMGSGRWDDVQMAAIILACLY